MYCTINYSRTEQVKKTLYDQDHRCTGQMCILSDSQTPGMTLQYQIFIKGPERLLQDTKFLHNKFREKRSKLS